MQELLNKVVLAYNKKKISAKGRRTVARAANEERAVAAPLVAVAPLAPLVSEIFVSAPAPPVAHAAPVVPAPPVAPAKGKEEEESSKGKESSSSSEDEEDELSEEENRMERQ